MSNDRESRSRSSEGGAGSAPAPRAVGKRSLTAGLPESASLQLRAEPTYLSAPPPPGAPVAHEDPYSLHLLAEQGLAQPATTLPHQERIQASFGPAHDLSHVQAHVGGAAADAAGAMGASAYATGDHVAFAAQPDLHTAAHEAAHVVQQARGVQLYGGVGAPGDPYEREADAVADRVVAGESAADLLPEGKEYAGGRTDKGDSARFDGDKNLEEIKGGTKKVGTGGRGLTVTKLQQALIDLGFLLPTYGVDGKFEGETKTALLKFQKSVPIAETGELDKATIDALHKAYDKRKPYIDRAKHDPADPGTRTLSADDKKAAIDAMVPPKGAGGAPDKFEKDKPAGSYGDRIKDRLNKLIAHFHKDLFDDKKPLRADPAKNFHDWSTLEGPAAGAKKVTDALYDTNYGGSAAFPAMTHAGGNLIDQWEDEENINKGLTKPQKKSKAEHKVWYLINSNCATINKEHGATPSATEEKKILTPIVESFIDTDAEVQKLLDLEIGWEGAQLDGVVYLQRYKSTDPDKKAAKEKDRVQMWELFNTCIHEYLHTLAHKDYQDWAKSFKRAKDETRYNTLIEGFCDFFTLNVRETVKPDAALQAQIEGPYANGNPPPVVNSGVYPSHRQAEAVVSIVGIKNAQAAYFRGDTKAMGKT